MAATAGRRQASSAAAAVLTIMCAAACSPTPPGPDAYAATISSARAAKDEFLRTAKDSPIPPEQRAAMLPLPYFPPDEAWSAPAALEPSDPSMQSNVEMPTSTGDRRSMRRVGVLSFTLQGRQLRLSAFVEADAPSMDRLFVPFADETSGKETYAAGRYLDLDRTATNIYLVDFNRAYNPYCAYNPKYDCPYPPRENHLPLAIRAGERAPVVAAH